jgi:hypothetical protein
MAGFLTPSLVLEHLGVIARFPSNRSLLAVDPTCIRTPHGFSRLQKRCSPAQKE